jgi:hypothetical protein
MDLALDGKVVLTRMIRRVGTGLNCLRTGHRDKLSFNTIISLRIV